MRARFADRRRYLAALLLCCGCAKDSGITVAGRVAEVDLLAEARGLGSLFAPAHLLFVAAVLVGAAISNALLQALLRLGWRLGFDSQRRWVRRSALARWLLAGLAALAIVRGAFVVAPALTTLFTLLALLGVLLLSGLLPSVLAGAGLTLRRTIRVGDRVRVGQQEGVVREMSLLRLRLAGPDGSTILLPNRLLTDLPVVVDRARHSVPARARVTLKERPDAALLEKLRQAAALSPYRAPDSLVDISRSPDDELQVIVEIQVWAARAQRDARAQLEAAVRGAADGRSSVVGV
jgi:small-conductance mechanosensitive channel